KSKKTSLDRKGPRRIPKPIPHHGEMLNEGESLFPITYMPPYVCKSHAQRAQYICHGRKIRGGTVRLHTVTCTNGGALGDLGGDWVKKKKLTSFLGGGGSF
ncbi:hypothetical protein JTE90_010353, partial [Oedothorax gibbosus]